MPAGPGARPVAGKKTGKCYHPSSGRSTRLVILVALHDSPERPIRGPIRVRAAPRPVDEIGFTTRRNARKDERMTPEDRETLIARYAAGFEEVTRALEGFRGGDLTAHPISGKWSAAEIVHHLADSETTAAVRLRKLLTEDHAVIQGYDQERFATRLRYNERPIAPAVDAFRAARETTLQILHGMREEDWMREGWHTDSGLYTSETWLRIYAAHAHDHAAQIRRLREALTPAR